MKKTFVLIITAVTLAIVVSLSSCESAPSTKIDLKTTADTISYSFGASIAQNLESSLQQSGILADTFAVYMEYSARIEMSNDDTQKGKLQKEMRHKIDSTRKANEYAILNFLSGFKEGVNARASKNSYNLGLAIGNQISQQAVPGLTQQFLEKDSKEEINKAAIVAAVSAAMQQKKEAFPNASSYLMMKSQEMQQKDRLEKEKSGEKNRLEGERFLEKNKTNDGVVALPSGVQYKILKEGKGVKPTAADQVKVHYHGTLLDGTVFDSSVERGEPAVFGVGQVIPGWTEILQLMPVGSKWEVYIPYDKAYGERGTGGDIGPFSTLKFDVELLDVIK